jgi:dCTP deaminase
VALNINGLSIREYQLAPGDFVWIFVLTANESAAADDFRIFNGKPDVVLDPKKAAPELFTEFKGAVCTIPSNSFVLGRSLEYFRIPRNVITITTGKSTYARCGVIVNVTPLEPEWEGLSRFRLPSWRRFPVKIFVMKFGAGDIPESDEPMPGSPTPKKSQYQAQKVITTARIKD